MTVHSTSSTPPNEAEFVYTLIERYWLGETSPEETETVQVWLQTHPEWNRSYERLRSHLQAGNWVDLSTTEVNARLANVLDAAGVNRRTTAPRGHQHSGPSQAELRTSSLAEPNIQTIPLLSRQRPIARWMGYAFATCVFSVISLIIGWGWNAHHVDAEIAHHKSIYTTPNGQRANILLPDGSEVVLNAGSRLEVPANFALGVRDVRLSGEAFFHVVQQTGVPFTVRAGSSVTRVLGTRFAVRYYETDTMATIAVQDGKVVVQSAVLTAHQEIHLLRHGLTQVQPASVDRFSFATGRLIINGRLLQNIIPELNRWYDVEIQLGDSTVGSQRLTLKSSGGSVSDLKSILELALPVHVVREGRRLIIYPKERS